jgi:Holliday junction DNA helicase RuvA
VIARLEGTLIEKRPTDVVINVSGVGYAVNVPLSTFAELPDEGKVVALRVYTQVRDDTICLFGFASPWEYEAFLLLLRANRVGPKLAQTILSGMDARALLAALASGDKTALAKVPGIGAKTASRLALELGERASAALGAGEAEQTSREAPRTRADAEEQLLSALANLGVPKGQAEKVVAEVTRECGPDASIETLVRSALPRLAR